jgi:hypothetical protein
LVIDRTFVFLYGILSTPPAIPFGENTSCCAKSFYIIGIIYRLLIFFHK